MKQDDTKQKILDKALELFSERGYDAVSVGEVAKAVGIKAPSLYNHYKSKQAIFEAIVEAAAIRYERDTDKIEIHTSDAARDVPSFEKISLEALTAKVCEMFSYSLHDDTISRLRRMITIEQFRSPELARLYSGLYVKRMVDYHVVIFRGLIDNGEIVNEDPEALSVMYVSPILVLLGVCDREPEREEECVSKLVAHVRLFYTMVQADKTHNAQI